MGDGIDKLSKFTSELNSNHTEAPSSTQQNSSNLLGRLGYGLNPLSMHENRKRRRQPFKFGSNNDNDNDDNRMDSPTSHLPNALKEENAKYANNPFIAKTQAEEEMVYLPKRKKLSMFSSQNPPNT
jgi:hypothetical protein